MNDWVLSDGNLLLFQANVQSQGYLRRSADSRQLTVVRRSMKCERHYFFGRGRGEKDFKMDINFAEICDKCNSKAGIEFQISLR